MLILYGLCLSCFFFLNSSSLPHLIGLGRYLYLSREDYDVMKAKGAVVCEEIVDEPSGETRFKILVGENQLVIHLMVVHNGSRESYSLR